MENTFDRDNGIKAIIELQALAGTEESQEDAGKAWDDMSGVEQAEVMVAYKHLCATSEPPAKPEPTPEPTPEPETPPTPAKEPPATLQVVDGDATNPQADGVKFIIHCCNDVGAWGAGFVLALSQKWPATKQRYHSWYLQTSVKDATGPFKLGHVQFVPVEDDVVVCNMIGQRGVAPQNGEPPIRYAAIEACLEKVREKIEAVKQAAPETVMSVHCPKFGAGLAGGEWKTIESLLRKEMVENGISVTVYELV